MPHSLHAPALRACRARRDGCRAATTLALAAVAAAPLFGCSAINSFDDPVAVGDWFTNSLTAGGNRSTMSVELTGEGRAKLHYVLQSDPEQTPYQDSFDIDWEQSRDGDTKAEFELRMRCKSSTLPTTGCSGHDFTMKCKASWTEDDETSDEMTCSGEGVWASITFQWERD